VGWANSSLRPLDRLPPLPPDAAKSARGVVLEDPLSAAWTADEWARLGGAAGGSTNGAGAAASAARTPASHPAASYEPSRQYEAGRLASPLSGRSGDGAWQALRSNSAGPDEGAVGRNGNGASKDSGDDEEAEAAGQAAEDDDWAGVTVGMVRAAATANGNGQAVSELAATTATAEAAESDLRQGLAGASVTSAPAGAPATLGRSNSRAAASGVPPPETRAERVSIMLQRLSALSWRRIDVSFAGATWGLGACHGTLCSSMCFSVGAHSFGELSLGSTSVQLVSSCPLTSSHPNPPPTPPPAAHNNIQVTRRILNVQGKAVPRHLAEQLAAMEGVLAQAEGEGGSAPRRPQLPSADSQEAAMS
jgi:hypothetical protein